MSRKNKQFNMTIPEYFDGKSIFITGGSGFLGKVLIEKLLWCCPGIEKIYVLLRQKKGKGDRQRLQDMLSTEAFDRLKKKDIGRLKKLIPVQGDVMEKKLGLKDEDLKLLQDSVSIVFHTAASVRFDDPLAKAILMNTRGTHELVKICLGMKNLEVFVHTSTTYCNTDSKVIEEEVYPPPADWRSMIKLAENIDHHLLSVFETKILNTFPNTYTYTKNLAESLVKDFDDRLPVVIWRPSIVTPSHQDPCPGWVDNFNGPVGLIVASGKGIIRSIYCKPNAAADYIPADIVIRAMIAATWHRGTRQSGKTEVYNSSAFEAKKITQQELVQFGHWSSRDVPLNGILWLPGGNVTDYKSVHYIRVFFLQLIPAMLIDFIFKLNNKPAFMMKLQRKIFVANEALKHFTLNEWTFKNDKFMQLENEILDSDKNEFTFDYHDVDVLEYIKTAIKGGREFLLKEQAEDIPLAKKHYNRMYWLDKAMKIVLIAVFAYLAIRLRFVQRTAAVLRAIYRLLNI